MWRFAAGLPFRNFARFRFGEVDRELERFEARRFRFAVDRAPEVYAPELLWSRFPISAVEQEGRVIDPSTMEWWSNVGGPPSEAAQAAMTGQGGELWRALLDLLHTVKERAAGRPVLWWGDPSAFDGALLLSVLDPLRLAGAVAGGNPLAASLLPLAKLEHSLGAGLPLYKRIADLGTLKWRAAFAGETIPNYDPTTKHDPVDDVMAAGRELADLLNSITRPV